jgi:hypothetical protein
MKLQKGNEKDRKLKNDVKIFQNDEVQGNSIDSSGGSGIDGLPAGTK